MEFKPIRHRFVAVLASFALVATASVTTAHTASAEELDTTDWSTLSETSSDSSTAEFVSEVILADTETFAIEPGVESESGVTVPESLDEPITIDGLTLDVPSAPGAEPMLTEVGDVIVPSENEGADLIIQEVDTTSLNFEAAATRTLITIDSQDVDPLFEFALDVPEGGSVDVDAETGSVVAYDADGNVSSLIAPPWAYDAEEMRYRPGSRSRMEPSISTWTTSADSSPTPSLLTLFGWCRFFSFPGASSLRKLFLQP